MGWDDGDKGNPWQKNNDNKGPADLDALVRDLQRKLSGLFGGGGKRGGNDAGPSRNSSMSGGAISGVVVLALVAWLGSGFYTVDDAERAVVLRFGEHVATQQPGLRWHLPWPIEEAEKINISENVSYPYSGSMLTRDENIVDIDLIVQYRRTNPEEYIFNLRNPMETLEDVTGSAIREVVGKNLLDFIITDGRAEIAAQAQDLLQDTLDDYKTGITIFEVNLQNANFPTEVEGAVQDAIQAREDRERFILEAETYRNEVLPGARGQAARQLQEAEGYRSRAIANAEGEASRFTQLLREYQLAPEVTRERLYLETLENVLSRSNKVIIDTEGGNNLLYLPLDQLIQQRAAPTSNLNQPQSLPSQNRNLPSSAPQSQSRSSR